MTACQAGWYTIGDMARFFGRKEQPEQIPTLGNGGHIPSDEQTAQIAVGLIHPDGSRGPSADLHEAGLQANHPTRRRKGL